MYRKRRTPKDSEKLPTLPSDSATGQAMISTVGRRLLRLYGRWENVMRTNVIHTEDQYQTICMLYLGLAVCGCALLSAALAAAALS
jgi:hypothetical protein